MCSIEHLDIIDTRRDKKKMRTLPRSEVLGGKGFANSSASLPPCGAPSIADLQVVQVSFEPLDVRVSRLEVLVEPVALRNELNKKPAC